MDKKLIWQECATCGRRFLIGKRTCAHEESGTCYQCRADELRGVMRRIAACVKRQKKTIVQLGYKEHDMRRQDKCMHM